MPWRQAPVWFWQKPASRVIRPHASYLRKEARCRAAAKKLLVLRLPRNITQGSADPCANPVVLIKQCLPCRALLRFLPALSFWIAAAIRYAIRSTIRLPGSEPAVFRRRKAFLLCKNPCGGTAVGMGSPPQSAEAPPAQRNFQRKFALRQVGSSKFVVPPTRERSKVRNIARLVTCPCRAAPGCQRDRGPFCFGKSPEEPLPRGSFGQLLRGGSTPRFFAQLRSVGSKPTRLAGSCQSTPGPWTTGPAQKSPPLPRSTAKPPLPAGSKKIAGLSSGDFRYLICCYMP